MVPTPNVDTRAPARTPEPAAIAASGGASVTGVAATIAAPSSAAVVPVTEAGLLAVVDAMLRELRGGELRGDELRGDELRGDERLAAGLDDELDRTLGIDSLARMELMLRLESTFGVRMPEQRVQAARTVRDLLDALTAGSHASGASATPPHGGPADVEAASAGRAAPAAPAGLTAPTVPEAPAAPAVGIEPPHRASTLIEVLRWYAQRHPARPHLRLTSGDGPPEPIGCAELLERAEAVAAGLQQAGAMPGDRVALMLPTGFEFFEAFAGILLAGAVPVPIYPPFQAARIEDHLRRQALVLDNAGVVLLVGDARVLPAARLLGAGAASVRRVVTVAQLRATGARASPAPRAAGDIALIQYTSGSTGQPKGVVLTHANLLANVRAIGKALKAGPDDVFVSWLPLYHDMGLIGAWMGSLYHGIPLVLMPPQAFLARPSRWLRAISEHGGTLSAAPNFAYEILAAKVPDGALRGLDLRRWRVALNGAEPVQPATIERFARRFAPHGFDARAMMPVYGLAEGSLALAFPPLGRAPRIDRIDRRALADEGRARPLLAAGAAAEGSLPGSGSPPENGPPAASERLSADDARCLEVASCGRPLAGLEIRVVDPRGAELPERREGRIEFRGPSATAGYFRNPQADRALFHGAWLDTGDLGYLAEGELYLTGRVKDLIIRAGHNVHPQDLEQAVGELPGVRRGCVAVFGSPDPASGTERIVVLAETRLGEAAERAALRDRIAGLAIALLGMPADDIVLAGAHAVPKTSSGKIRRAAARALYEQKALGRGARPVAWQMARLAGTALARRARGALQRVPEESFAARAWAAFGLGALAALAAALLPGIEARRGAARCIARMVLRGAGLMPAVEGAGRLRVDAAPAGQPPPIFVANHASYLDWLVLMAVLPAGAVFVAKRELARSGPARWLLQRVGTRFVERDDAQASVEDARELQRAHRAGQSLVFFPEGTLTRAPGLRGFRMGAFVAAAQSGAAIVPLSLRGTRSVLRDGSWAPRRQPLSVRVHEPLRPRASGWAEALRLRDAARSRIAEGCDEPLLPP